jgi:hypothetical protein
MGTKSRETLFGSTIRASAEKAAEARREADVLACQAWNYRMLGYKGPAQPSPTLGDALNAGYGYLEVRCLGCDTHQTVALAIIRRRKCTPIHELERYMRSRTALRSGAIRTSGVTSWRCDRLRSARWSRRQFGGRAKDDLMRMKPIIISAAICLPLFAFLARRSMWLDVYGAYAPETYAAVVRIAPVGTPISEATSNMQWRGFKCTPRRNQPYAGDNVQDPRKGQVYFPASDFVGCRASRWLPDLFPKWWGVIFAYGSDGAVSNIAVAVNWDTL